MSQLDERIAELNKVVHKALTDAGALPVIQGNLFYQPRESLTGPYTATCITKRQRYADAVKGRTCMFEIGMNAGHSAMLALESDPNIVVYSNDLGMVIDGFRHDIYADAAAKFLKETYGDRFHFLLGDCTQVVPTFIKENPDIKFDIVHIDGAKETYTDDYYNFKPALVGGATVIIDDANIPRVRTQIDQLINVGELERREQFPRYDEAFTNEILFRP